MRTLYPPQHRYESSLSIYAVISTQTAHPCGLADTEEYSILCPGDNLQYGATLTQKRHYGA